MPGRTAMSGSGFRMTRWDWLALAVGLVLATAFLLLWLDLLAREDESLRGAMRHETEDVEDELRWRIESHLRSIGRLAAVTTWSAEGIAPGGPGALATASDDLLALVAIDADGEVLRVVSRPGVAAESLIAEMDPWTARRVRDGLEAARVTSRPVVAATQRLGRGGSGLVLAAASRQEGELRGFLLGLFDCQALLGPLLASREARGALVEVFDGRERLYTRSSDPEWEGAWAWSWERMLELPGGSWRVRAQPSADLVERRQTFVPWLVLALGLWSAVATTLALRSLLPRLATGIGRIRRSGDGRRDAAVERPEVSRKPFDWGSFERDTLKAACECSLPPRLAEARSHRQAAR